MLSHIHVQFFTSDKSVSSVQKKISEVELNLLLLPRDIDTPEICLSIHPTVQRVIKQAAESGHQPTVEDFSDSLSDSTFLNDLQIYVTCWIREIQKVLHIRYDLWCYSCQMMRL